MSHSILSPTISGQQQMALDVLDWTSILGLWTFVSITTFLILCWKRIYYVYHLRDARRERTQNIQDEIRSLRGLDSGLDGAFSHALHSSIQDQERRLSILSRTEISQWIRFSALFRPDPCLRLLEELEEYLRQKVQRVTDVRLTILGGHNARQTDAALPTADMSLPQTCGACATHQHPESASYLFSCGHSPTINSMARQLMEDYIKNSNWYKTDMVEPSVGDVGVPTCALFLTRSGESVYRCFVDARKDQEGNTEHYCSACGFKSGRLDRLIEHQRSKRGHRPFALREERSWEALFQEVWYLKQEEEPLNHLGQSILIRWLNRFDDEVNGWSCRVPLEDGTWCTQTIGRLDRAITHIRGHLGHRPYPCEGKCRNQDCSARFSSKERRMAHYHGPNRRRRE